MTFDFHGVCQNQLVEEVIRTVKPTVVMVELDARRVRLLPAGDAYKVSVVRR